MQKEVILVDDKCVTVTLRKVQTEQNAVWELNGAASKESDDTDIAFELSFAGDKWSVSHQSICHSLCSSRALARVMVHVWRWQDILDRKGVETVFEKTLSDEPVAWCVWDCEEISEHLMEYGIDIDEALLEIGDAITWDEFIHPGHVLSTAKREFEQFVKQCTTALKAIDEEANKAKVVQPENTVDEFHASLRKPGEHENSID